MMRETRALACALALSLALTGCASKHARLQQGIAALEREDYSTAVARLDEAASKYPEAYLYRGDAYAAMAAAARSGSQQRATYYENALSDYLASGLDEAKPRLISLYLDMGDEAAAQYDYPGAEADYNAALDLNHANAEAYGRMAELYLLWDRPLEAARILEKGITASHDAGLSDRLDQLKAVFDEKEAETRRLAAAQALRDAPYYGDVNRCVMGPEQALAFARLIAEGLTGQFQGYAGYGRPLYDGKVYWDEPYAVLGLGSYETDRSRVILGDFADDGVPYLYVFSGMVKEKSFEIFGWDGEAVSRIAGAEAYGSGQEGALSITSQGLVVLRESEPTGERSRSGRTLRFADGKTSVYQVWDEAYDPSADVMRLTTNGVADTYTPAQWAGRPAPATGDLDEVMNRSLTLREMMAVLNGYAVAMGSPALDAASIPPEHSSRHRMATAMMRQLFALNRQSVDEAEARLCDTRLLDLDGDGQEELFAAFQGTYRTGNNVPCQFALYRWQDGELAELPGGTELDELHLVRTATEYGILGAGRDPDLPLTDRSSLTDLPVTETEGESAAQPETVSEAAETPSGETGEAQTGETSETAEAQTGETNGTSEAQTGETGEANETDAARTEEPSSETPAETTPTPTRQDAARAEGEPYTLTYLYTFLTHSEEISVEWDGAERTYRVLRGGREAAIAESEFASIRERYTVLETLVNFRTSPQNRNYSAAIAALDQIRASAP